eukprot:351359-Chlamydomonas_euryale.AAC.2
MEECVCKYVQEAPIIIILGRGALRCTTFCHAMPHTLKAGKEIPNACPPAAVPKADVPSRRPPQERLQAC